MRRFLRLASPASALAIAVAACAPAPSSSIAPDPVPSVSVTAGSDAPMATSTPDVSSVAPLASAEAERDPLLSVTLTDVRSGEAFTLGELAADHGPVLLEPMAVWCSNCRAQQHEVQRAHATAPFTSVSLDVDLSELPDDLAAYADREGFDWRFAMADTALYRLLQDRFGVGATNPPSTPLIVVEPDGTIRPLEFGRGIRSAEELLVEVVEG